jgi:hypothetical protein
MAQMQIRGSTQIIDATVTNAKLAGSITSANLVDGANFLKKDGSVAMTAAFNAGNFVIGSVGDPVASQDAVNLRTAQALINGIALRRAKIVATSNQALTALPTIDGVTLVDSEIILLTAQSTASQNGPWAVHSGAWTRPTDWAAASTQQSTMFFVSHGTTNHDTKWIAITDAITVDTTSVTISQDLSGTTYTAGNGLNLAGSAFSVVANGASLNVSASGVKIADGTPAQVMLANASNAATFTTVTGDVTISSTGVTTVNVTAGTGFLKYGFYVPNETPSGSVNGSNTGFTLANTPQVSSVQLYQNGLLLEPGAGNDYTISGTAITMLTGPITGDKLRAYYWK